METMDVDDALKLVGGYRRWHLSMFCLLGLTVFMPLCWQGLSIVFIGWAQPHHCRVPAGRLLNESIPTHKVDGQQQYRQCAMYVNDSSSNQTTDCQDGWTYNSEYTSIVSEWDLVCEKDFLSDLSQTIYQVGCLCGELFGAYLVDRFGRRLLHIAASLIVVVLGIGLAFTQTFIAFVAVRTLLGFFVTCNLISGLTMIMELFDSKRRAFAGICLEYAWIVVYLVMPALAYILPDWRHFQLAISTGTIIGVIYFFLLPESAVWLSAQGRYDEAEKVLEKMAKWNGLGDVKINLTRLPPALLVDYKKYMEEKKKRRRSVFVSRRGSNPKPNPTMRERKASRFSIAYEVQVIDMVRDPVLRRHTIIASLFWFANNLVYFGLILSTPTLAGNRFINYLIGALVEIPAYVITLFVVERYGRRVPLCVFHVIAGVPLSVTGFIPSETASGTDLSPLLTTFAMVAKFGISGSFAIIVLYTRELFPTNLRGTSGGLCNVLGRVGNMVAPFAAYVARNSVSWLPNTTFGVVSIAVGFVVLLLPETTNRPLPDTLDDILKLYPEKRRESMRRDTYRLAAREMDLEA